MGDSVRFGMGNAEEFLCLPVAAFFNEHGNPMDEDQLLTHDLTTVAGSDVFHEGMPLPRTFGDIFDKASFLEALESRYEVRELVRVAVHRGGNHAGARISDSSVDSIEFYIELLKFFPDEQRQFMNPPIAAPAVCLTNWQLENNFIPVIERLYQRIDAGDANSIEPWQYEGLFSQYIRDLHEFMTASMIEGYKDFMAIVLLI